MVMEFDTKKIEKIRDGEFKRLVGLKAHGDTNGNFIVNGKRLVLMGADYFMAEVLKILKEYVGPTGGGILYNIGVEAGKEYFKAHHVEGESVEDTIGKFFGFLMYSGYSKITFDGEKIIVPSSPTADMWSKNIGEKTKTCYYLSGLFAGFLSELFKKQLDVREVKCMAAGHDRCEFEIFE